jgi:tRNA (guanine37-N1)-methyltransferase
LAVPEVLLGGDHHAVRLWRREQQLRKTMKNRPDLLEKALGAGALSEIDRKLLIKIENAE